MNADERRDQAIHTSFPRGACPQRRRGRESSEGLAFVARLWLPLLTLLLIGACQSIQSTTNTWGLTDAEEAKVSVPFPQIGEPQEVLVTSSGFDNSEQGVRLLRAGEYAQAAERFEHAVAENTKDHHSWFGLGVARETLGDDAAAKKAYVEAFAIESDRREYEQALMRIKVKLGEEEL